MRWQPHDAVAVVTGATSGIGRALTGLLVAGGATVVASGRREHRLTALVDANPQQIMPVVGDIADPAVRKQIVAVATAQRSGQVDLLVNNAGIGAVGPFATAAPERLRKIMEVNFFAPAELTRALIPSLQRGRAPVICNISSVLGHRAVPDKSEYCASKFALHGWSDALRAELAACGIAVTLVSPSTTSSEFFESLVDSDQDQTAARMGSWTPQHVAAATLAAIVARRSEAILSIGGKLLVYGDRLSPPLMNWLLNKPRSNER